MLENSLSVILKKNIHMEKIVAFKNFPLEMLLDIIL